MCNARYHFVVPAAAGPLSAADGASLAGLVERSAAAAAAAAMATAPPAASPVNGPNQSAAAAIHARDLANKAAAAHPDPAAPAAAGGSSTPADAAPAAPSALVLQTEDALESTDRAVSCHLCHRGYAACRASQDLYSDTFQQRP